MPGDKKSWYAVYTKPRWEKKVFGLLQNNGIEAYCPLNKVRKKWSDRIKWVEEPLFKSYVFVRVVETDLSLVRCINGVVNFVYWLGKPARVRESEIQTIRKFLDSYDDVTAVPLDLQTDSKVTIRRGPLMDKQGTVIKVFRKKVQVVIESIGFALVAVVDRSNVAMNNR
ncbi:UpxY family transcription antiterminator [Puia dinghuensis]|uniref:Transcriptional antiterminator n=1 Tax=Puia dinghuensis TaxID=1792502 RepID=A0A8J2UEZ1_9BACT|nr:UpxY family transcription antiterminator [Puia dinghuensis]GGB08691.1 transcriptional antiterminator [Puia dinghuensis]